MANSTIISELKTKVITEIINDELIVQAIDCPDSTKEDWEPIFLINNKDTIDKGFQPCIFREMQNPDLITKTMTFLCVEVSIPRSYDNVWVKPALQIMIVSHNQHMLIDNIPTVYDNRNDYLSILIDKKFNGMLDYGSFKLESNVPSVYSDKFLCRTLTFTCLEINDSLCDN